MPPVLRQQPCVADFADSLGIAASYVSLQAKERTREEPSASREGKPQGISALSGTHVIDRAWKALKTFVSASLSRRLGHGSDSHENEGLRLMVVQHMWRQHLLDLCAKLF